MSDTDTAGTKIIACRMMRGHCEGVLPSMLPNEVQRAILQSLQEQDRLPASDPKIVERAVELCSNRDAVIREIDEAVGMMDVTLAMSPAELARVAASLRRTYRVEEARKSLDGVMQRYERGEVGPEAVADAWRELSAAERDHGARSRRPTEELVNDVLATMRKSQGRDAIGLRTPGLQRMSARLFGWRGLIFLGAMPGIGKTTYLLQAGIDAVESNPDTVLVYCSLEMSAQTMVARLLSQLSGIPDRMLRVGDASERPDDAGLQLNGNDRDRLNRGRTKLAAIMHRVVVVDAADIGSLGGTDADGSMRPIERIVDAERTRTRCGRAFVVVDNLQAMAVMSPKGELDWRDDMERDRYAIAGLLAMQRRLGEDDPVVVVSEARKADFDRPDMASLLGTGRSAYSADAVVVMRTPTPSKSKSAQKDDDTEVDAMPAWQELRVEDRNRIGQGTASAVEVAIVKGRDMMRRGVVRCLFDITKARFDELGDA